MFIEYASALDFLIVVVASISLYVGLCAYIKGMVDDLEAQMQQINDRLLDADRNRQNDLNNTVACVKAIRLHYTNIG